MSLEPDTIGNLGGVTGSQCSYICEILCFAIKAHSYRSKYYILGSSVTAKLILLLRAPESYVKLAALRVFRTCIGMKDEFYNRHLLKHDIFSAILQCFRDTGGKYNLLNSACLDVFDFIRKENIKSLVANIVQNHKSMFIDIVYIDTFKSLVLRYEQNQDVPASLGTDETSSAKSIDRPKPDGWSRMDNDEEAYFNDESDDEKEAEENKRKANGNSRNSSEELRQVAGVPKINLIAATNISSSGGGAVNGHAMKRSASPLGLVDYEDDEDDDMIDLIAKKRADTGSIGGTSVKIAGSTTNTLTGGSVTGGVKAVEANIEDVGRVGGDGSGSRRVSFTLNAVAVGAVGAIAAKRRRTGSFSSEDGDK
ncbi:hypothetical protein HK100_002698 [Physocladia obscura]|uniref:Serine/threonine-protein phosphatase 4 regulatory subunit 3-like central domain-containing protein n=1 Tax=Physocladia obscura TaxID=109957 RepID=A0AAD5SV18_9FUNG|nr:hypothetical protein HK100_002698 [Physocladia obscura]